MIRSPISSFSGQPAGTAPCLAGYLQGFDRADDFVHVAADFLGVVQDEADFAVRIDHKDRAHRVGALAGMQHAQLHGHGVVGRDNGELYFYVSVRP